MERLTLSLSTMIIGMLVVFCGLVILIACIYAMTSVTGRKKKQAETKAPAEAAPAAVEEAPAEEPAEDAGVMAAIAAAIVVIWEGEGSGNGFVVRRIRRAQSSTARARAARDEQIFSRL
ncbi:MAG: OadG family protein [Clostridia bacterium]|nr:OadG family protein [Clostridia bacterium]